ncbi:MAG: 1-acyl-sn-glycerol-3-phosphate acyltransferase, partial [Proteobacteria bacterium]|nr:1-acyl-sn-glycerol-3-phosphate acyltransferase [Pseudomonadota bacterium]
VIVIGFFYLIPALRLFTFFIKTQSHFFLIINRKLGYFEHAVAWFRDTLVVLYLLCFGSWYAYYGYIYGRQEWGLLALASLALVGLSYFNWKKKQQGRLALVDFVRSFPNIHPQEFFDHLLCMAGVANHILPAQPFQMLDLQNLDFKNPGKKKISLWRKLKGVWSTIWLKRLCLLALKAKGKDFLKEASAGIAVVWGTRLSQLVYAEVKIEQTNYLEDLKGINIYLFNHLSFLDFALAPILLGGKSLPKFLMAKDHFLDNPIFYRILGIGQVAKALDMIFVERKGKKDAAQESIAAGVRQLVEDSADLAVFPQGSRAYARVGRNQERLDGGYYAVGKLKRLKKDDKHLKKGTAYLAVETAKVAVEKGEQDKINLIPVAIKGAGIIAPKGSRRLKPNVKVVLKIGQPFGLTSADALVFADGADHEKYVDQLHQKIDQSLKATLQVHVDLERRFFEDMRKILQPFEAEEVALAMKTWRGDDYLVHSILDCIYTCKPKLWWELLGRLIYLIRNDAPREDLLKFKAEVAARFAK